MFIKLTGHLTDVAMYVCTDKILFLGTHQDGYTHIQFSNLEAGIGVKETPEQIMEMIKNA